MCRWSFIQRSLTWHHTSSSISGVSVQDTILLQETWPLATLRVFLAASIVRQVAVSGCSCALAALL